MKKLWLHRKFAQTMESTQRMHRWIAYDLRKSRKLIRSETNTQILRNLDFCDQNLHFFDTHVDARFPVLCYYSQSQEGSTSHCCEPFPPIFDKHVETRFPLPLYYPQSLERLYESCKSSALLANNWRRNPLGWAPGRAAQIEQLARREHFFENVDDSGTWPEHIPEEGCL